MKSPGKTGIIFYVSVILGFIQTYSFAQNDTTSLISSAKSEYKYGHETVARFNETNFDRILGINKAIALLPIDKCHNGRIKTKLEIDTLGITSLVTIQQGAGNTYLDSMVNNTISGYPGKWKVSVLNGIAQPYHARIVFALTDVSGQASDDKNNADQMNYLVVYSEEDYDKKCLDNNYYYETGLLKFDEGNFSSAAADLKKSLLANPYDLDSQYYLGMAYLKSHQIKKSCDCFIKGKNLGDERAKTAFFTHCNPSIEQ